MQVLLVNSPGMLKESTALAVGVIGGSVTETDSYRDAIRLANSGSFDAVVFAEPDASALEHGDSSADGFVDLMRAIEAERLAGLMIDGGGSSRRELAKKPKSLLQIVDSGISPDELRGRLATIDRYQSMVQRMEHELSNMERMGKRLTQHFSEVDQEMRLAARLQREFLPDLRNPIGGIRFSSVFRPASWVSGDIYDVFRVDEEHIGFYIADAVGHGMAAGLLTMFIKRSIVSKRISGSSYEVCTPSEVMAILNDALADQSLPHCQFVTAFYGLLNTTTMKLQYARSGHPYPILLGSSGESMELKSPGGLLGIFAGEDFPMRETQLNPGEKLILFTDGVETVFQEDDSKSLDKTAYRRAFEEFTDRPLEDMLNHIDDILDAETGSILPRDDVTVVGLQIPD